MVKFLIRSLFCVVAGLGLLHVGGWSLLWGVPDFFAYFHKESIFFDGKCIAINVNHSYYGVVLVERYFYFPILSYIALGLAGGCFWIAYDEVRDAATFFWRAFSDSSSEKDNEAEKDAGGSSSNSDAASKQ